MTLFYGFISSGYRVNGHFLVAHFPDIVHKHIIYVTCVALIFIHEGDGLLTPRYSLPFPFAQTLHLLSGSALRRFLPVLAFRSCFGGFLCPKSLPLAQHIAFIRKRLALMSNIEI